MDPALFARSVGLGFTIAAAIGPIGLLAIRRTLAHGPAHGLASGMGVALADASYAAIAAFGLDALAGVLLGVRVPLGLAGGAVLLWLGARTLRSRPATAAAAGAERPGLGAAFASIYGLTLANPMTILSFAALFAALVPPEPGTPAAATLTAGVFLGSAAWWVLLTAVVARLRSRVTVGALTWVNRVSGAVIVAFGATAIAGALRSTG